MKPPFQAEWDVARVALKTVKAGTPSIEKSLVMSRLMIHGSTHGRLRVVFLASGMRQGASRPVIPSTVKSTVVVGALYFNFCIST